MRSRFLSFLTTFVLLLNVAVFAEPGSGQSLSRTRQASRLIALLPASDAVALIDSKRFFNEALPRVLAANQPMLGEITAKLNEMETRTGIDLRKFDQVAVGAAIKQIGPKNFDTEPVAIASGDINAGALIAVARLASNGTYREEKIAGKTVYVFSAKDVLKNASTKVTNSKVAGHIEKFVGS